MNFKHFIITRFNLKVDNWETTRQGSPVLTSHWLNERFYLFEKYCLPSVINQIEKNFIWCIYFDINTPNIYRSKIKDIIRLYPFIEIFYINGIKELKPHFESFVRSFAKIDQDIEYVITTRLDNDDLLHFNFTKEIKKLFQPIDKTIIDLRNGYQLSIIKKKMQLREYINEFNPFISLVEKISTAETVISKMHKDWHSAQNVQISRQDHLWIEVVHKTNKSNDILHWQYKTYAIDLSSFGIETSNVDFESNLRVFIYNIFLLFKSMIATFANKILKENKW